VSEATRIADQLHRAVHGTAWHGPDVMMLLEDVDASRAAHRPIAAGHSIWEIVLHIVAWQECVLAALRGKSLPMDLPAEQDWPPPGATVDDWARDRVKLEETTGNLVRAIRELDDARLRERAGGREYSIYFLLHGIVQHTLYHAGQIAILKKAAQT
jgi:uncharacterized damage-inducible protein DinB